MSLSVNCFVQCIDNNLQLFSDQYHWKTDSAFKFQTALASNDVQQCIHNFIDNDNSENKTTDILLKDFNNIIYQAAELSLKKKKRSLLSNSKTKKPQRKQKHLKWYDFSLVCMKRNLYDKYKLLDKFPHDPLQDHLI